MERRRRVPRCGPGLWTARPEGPEERHQRTALLLASLASPIDGQLARPVRLAVRTSASHVENRGSIPLRGANDFTALIYLHFLFPNRFGFLGRHPHAIEANRPDGSTISIADLRIRECIGSETGKGEVRVQLSRKDEITARVSVSDEGVGLPDAFTLNQPSGSGTRLIKILAEQMGAEVIVERPQRGTAFVVTMSLDPDSGP